MRIRIRGDVLVVGDVVLIGEVPIEHGSHHEASEAIGHGLRAHVAELMSHDDTTTPPRSPWRDKRDQHRRC